MENEAWIIELQDVVCDLAGKMYAEPNAEFLPGYCSVPNDSEYVVENPSLWDSIQSRLCDYRDGHVVRIAVLGPGGVGKSTACIRIANKLKASESGKKRFPGGIYWMHLGPSTTAQDIIIKIGELVRNAGGEQFDQDCVRPCLPSRDVKGAAKHARRWFAEKRILLCVDDVWVRQPSPVAGANEPWADVLESILSPGSSFLFTTQVPELAEFGETVLLERLSSSQADMAVAIFNKYLHAYISEEHRPVDNVKARDTMLNFCNGLPQASKCRTKFGAVLCFNN